VFEALDLAARPRSPSSSCPGRTLTIIQFRYIERISTIEPAMSSTRFHSIIRHAVLILGSA